jgi:hypothetical protein
LHHDTGRDWLLYSRNFFRRGTNDILSGKIVSLQNLAVMEPMYDIPTSMGGMLWIDMILSILPPHNSGKIIM